MENKADEQLFSEVLHNKIRLTPDEVLKLKVLLQDYCKIYYASLDWAIKRVVQRLEPWTSSTDKIVIVDGTWLANSKNYYDVLV